MRSCATAACLAATSTDTCTDAELTGQASAEPGVKRRPRRTRRSRLRRWGAMRRNPHCALRFGLDADADGATQAGAAEAAVAVGILGQVLLVVVLGEVERPGVEDLGGDGAVAVGREHLLVGGLGGLGGLALG